MIVIGTFIRGPGWMWFWPGQTWDPTRVVYEVNRDLHELFGIKSSFGMNVFGASAVGLYVIVAGFVCHKLITLTEFSRKIYQRMNLLQYLMMQFFLITMLSLPIKILLRLSLRINYVWVTPWFSL